MVCPSAMGFPPHHRSPQRNPKKPRLPPRGFFFAVAEISLVAADTTDPTKSIQAEFALSTQSVHCGSSASKLVTFTKSAKTGPLAACVTPRRINRECSVVVRLASALECALRPRGCSASCNCSRLSYPSFAK